MDWGAIISAGVSLFEGLLEDETKGQELSQNKEIAILNLQDKERDRASKEEIAGLSRETQLAIANLSAQTDLGIANRRIMGDVLLDQGKGQTQLGIEAFRAAANKPKVSPSAISTLAQVLAR